ncbi:MAG: type II toxin-antitoxin system death-on-curing family toxin [Candidatus Parvarchaeum sp.]
MRKLTYNEIITINKAIGENGTIQNNNLEFIMDTAKDIDNELDYATTLLYEIPRAHSFSDGNKRTAFYAFAQFLKLNGYRLNKEPRFNDKMNRILNDIAMGKAKKNKVERLIKRLAKIEVHV